MPRGIDPGLRNRVYRHLKLSLSIASSVMVGAMMFLTFADVVARYVFNSPILGAYELTEVLMGLVIFGGLPLVSVARTHISVDFLSMALPARARQIQSGALNLICAAVSGVLAWRTWLYAGLLSRVGETTLELKISMGGVTYIVAVLMGLTAAVFLFNTLTMLSPREQKQQGRGY
jgi:TRAP-type C4-dicarboxylate transport system permease small subunit